MLIWCTSVFLKRQRWDMLESSKNWWRCFCFVRKTCSIPRNSCVFPERIHLFWVRLFSFIHFLPIFLIIENETCCNFFLKPCLVARHVWLNCWQSSSSLGSLRRFCCRTNWVYKYNLLPQITYLTTLMPSWKSLTCSMVCLCPLILFWTEDWSSNSVARKICGSEQAWGSAPATLGLNCARAKFCNSVL